jgi:BatD DUF11 like domain
MEKRLHHRGWVMAAIAISLMTLRVSHAAAPSVDATIEPSQINLGESARLTILTTGPGTLSIPLPVVAGLEFRVVGQSRQIQMTNGITIESTSTIIRVTPDTAGIFTIPGVTPNAPPLLLRVNPSGSGPPSLPNTAPLPFVPGGSNTGGVRLTQDGSAFVHLEIPKHEIYVGESVPVEIQIGTRNGFAVANGLPKLNSGDFTLNNLSSQPEHSEKVIDGKPFTVLVWHSVLAGVKPGTFSLAFEAPLTVRIRTAPRQDSLIDDLLGDPFLQNLFGASIRREITAGSPPAPITVLPLPSEGRPPGFTGAVGNFKVSSDISSAKTTAGDPLTLRLHVNGAGNFDRVESSMLNGDPQWKTYEPKASFKAADSTGYKGEKIFEQPLIAPQPGTHTVPPLDFSYFDPNARRYETAHSAPLTVEVAPAPESAGNEAPPPANPAGPVAGESHTALRPDHRTTDARVSSLVPLYFQPRFLTIPSVLVLLFGCGWMALSRLERNARGARERARLQLIRASLERMAAAAAGGNAGAFFNAARSGLQQTFSVRWHLAPEQITIADVDARFEGSEKDDIRQIFALSDEANYSGGELKAADFERWTALVRAQFAHEAIS